MTWNGRALPKLVVHNLHLGNYVYFHAACEHLLVHGALCQALGLTTAHCFPVIWRLPWLRLRNGDHVQSPHLSSSVVMNYQSSPTVGSLALFPTLSAGECTAYALVFVTPARDLVGFQLGALLRCHHHYCHHGCHQWHGESIAHPV